MHNKLQVNINVYEVNDFMNFLTYFITSDCMIFKILHHWLGFYEIFTSTFLYNTHTSQETYSITKYLRQ